MDQLDKRQEAVQKRREELAQQLVNQRERIQQRARDRFEDIPQLSMQVGDKSLEFEQWTVDELGNRKFLYFSYGDEAGQQVVLELDALNETGRRLGDMVISKVGDEIRITFTHLGEQNTISILTDSAGIPSGYSVSKITESGTVVETYDVNGNAVNNFELIRPQQPAVADAALTSSQQIRQQIDKLQAVPAQQRDMDKIQALKVQLVNSLLSDHDMFIDTQAEGYSQAAFDEIYNMINERADVLSPYIY